MSLIIAATSLLVLQVASEDSDSRCTDAPIRSANETSEDPHERCAFHVEWAKHTGIVTAPGDYSNYTNLTSESNYRDFQCVLWHMGVHGCPEPCHSLLPECKLDYHRTSVDGVDKTEESSMPTWVWVLVALVVVAAIGVASYFFCQEKKPEKISRKKKRAIPKQPKSLEKAPEVAPSRQASAPASRTGSGQYELMMAPIQTYPRAMQTYAAPTTAVSAQNPHHLYSSLPIQPLFS